MNREPQGAKGSHGNARGTRCHPGSTTHVEQLDGPLLCQGRPTRHTSVTSTVLEIRRAHPQANFFIPGRLKLKPGRQNRNEAHLCQPIRLHPGHNRYMEQERAEEDTHDKDSISHEHRGADFSHAG